MTTKPKKPENISRLAAALGVSRTTLYDWKRRGCPTNQGKGAVLEWLVDNPTRGDNDELREAKLAVLRETALHRRTIRLQLEGKLIPTDAVEAGSSIAVQTFCAEIDRMVRDLPSVLKGLDEAGIREKLKQHQATIKPRIFAAFDRIRKQSEPPR